MKVLSTLKLLALFAIPALCDNYTTEDCYCATPRSVGWLMTTTWESAEHGIHTYHKTDSVARTGRRDDLIGQRCDEGSTTENCINIPNIKKYAKKLEPLPWRVSLNCHAWEDNGLEICASFQGIIVNDKWRAAGRHVEGAVLDCAKSCKEAFGSRGDAYDICSYTYTGEGEFKGARLRQDQKIDKHGRIKISAAHSTCGIDKKHIDDVHPRMKSW